MENVNDFAAGIVGGVSGLLVGHPLDVIKVRQQMHMNDHSIVRIALDLAKKEGMTSLFRGIGPPILGVGGLNAVLFGTYGLAARMLTGKPQAKDDLTLGQSYIAGTVAGTACCTITTPTELLKCRAQVATVGKDLPHTPGSSPASTLYQMRAVYKELGILGMYKGWWVTVLRDAPSFGVYFFAYEAIKRRLVTPPPDPQEDATISIGHFTSLLFAGGVAGVVAWIVVYPVDVVKTRLQAQSLTSPQYKGIADCFIKMVRNEGPASLFRGISAMMLRSFPLNAVTFAVYEVTLHALQR